MSGIRVLIGLGVHETFERITLPVVAIMVNNAVLIGPIGINRGPIGGGALSLPWPNPIIP